jgi:putative ABC transport system permease protein
MLRNMMLASLGNLARNRLYAAINIGGLAIALAAAILIGLFVRDDLTFDRFIPGHADVYRLSINLGTPQGAPMPYAAARSDLAAFFKADHPQVRGVARLAPVQDMVRHGQVEAMEQVYWADPQVFDVLPLPASAGDARTALARPDGVVLTRRMARKYFGREDVVGQPLDLDLKMGPVTRTHRMLVTAVLQDLPDNTHLNTEILASGLAPYSPLAFFDQIPKSFGPAAFTYVRLAPGASAAPLTADLPAFGRRHIDPRPLLGGKMTVTLTPLTAIHFLPPSDDGDMKPPGSRSATLAIAGIGGLIVLMAAINFVSLMTARAGRRAMEVGVRKAVGASRGHITLQFLGEAVGYSLAALVLAIGLSELLAPLATSLVGRAVRPDYPHEPGLLLILVGTALVLGLLAGIYPALVMASFRAASVLKGGPVQAGGGGIRQGLAVVQFAILIGLVISALVIWRQTAFALGRGMDHGGDRRLLVSFGPDCLLLRERIKRLPGVEQATCGSLDEYVGFAPTNVTASGGRTIEITMGPTDYGLMEMHGLKPLAGRFLSESHPLDGVPQSGASAGRQPNVLINASAVRVLGFASPASAVGKLIKWQRLNMHRKGVGDDLMKAEPSEVVGVVPDYSLHTVRGEIGPILYYIDPELNRFSNVTVTLTGENVASTLAAISKQGPAMGQKRPMVLRFYSQIAQELYADITRQAAAVAASAALAVLIACLGLFGLAVFTAERRIKEIGVRKAMGAATSDIVALLLKAFTRPVLIANLIAWPIAGWAMQRWLQGFAYHVGLSPWYFVAGGGAAALIAVLTVLGHCIGQARARPVQALRYE